MNIHRRGSVNLVFPKLRREIGHAALAARLKRPLAVATSFDVALDEEHFCVEPVAAVGTIEYD
jgi:hypothetical protein